MDRKAHALQTYAKSFNCAQSVLSAFVDDLGIDRDTALKISGCFGSGMRCGEVCGAVTGSFMVLGSKYGHCVAGDLERKAHANGKSVEFLGRFMQAHGSILCRELLGHDPGHLIDLAIITNERLFLEVCPKIIASAVGILEEILEEE